jgi:PAS domain S-box-containing protein
MDVLLRSLEQERQLVFDLLDNLPMGVIAVNVNCEPMFVNQTLAALIGVSVKTILKAKPTDSLHWFEGAYQNDSLLNKCLQGIRMSTRGIFHKINGESVTMKIDAFPLYTKQGQIDGIILLCHDLRQQLIWERSFNEYKHILDSINAGVLAVDVHGIITTCNKNLAYYCNSSPEQLIGCYLPEVRTGLFYKFDYLMKTLKSNQPVSVPELWCEIEGKDYLFSLECNPITDAEGRNIGAVGVWRDISLQRMMELESNRSEKLALVGELAASTAHEIRNPLTSIRGFIQLLENRFSPDAAEQDYLKIMLSELDRANDIIKNFLLLAKPQEPKLQFQDLNFVLEELLKLVEAQSLMSDVQLQRNFCSDMPFMVMETESIKQVFLNLLQNAFQSMPNGGYITVSSEFDPLENHSVVKVTDTGIGIPKELLRKIGHPFFTTKQNGTGLGLAVSYRIIENHKGKIQVISQENVGTTFIVTLPVS